MKRIFQNHTISTGLAIFSMLFGAGNLIFPLAAGMQSGSQAILGVGSFLVTAVLLPLVGVLGMILYDGNYQQFFERLGKIPGKIFIFACMMVIGPIVAIPRITTLSHTMLAPHLSFVGLDQIAPYTSLIFAIIFLGITFLLTFRENNIVNILGYVISPLLLIALIVIIVKGLLNADEIIPNMQPAGDIIKKNLLRGFETLDLLGTIFFSAMIFTILKRTMGKKFETNQRLRMTVGLKSGTIGIVLLGLVYCGMGFLGAYHGHGLDALNEGALFREISTRILGVHGALVIAIAVLMACLSTSIALGAIVAEYLQKTIAKNKISFVTALAIVLLLCLPLSIFGLDAVLALTEGAITFIGYPILITLTLCNIAYKFFGFKPVKIPVLLTLVGAVATYLT
ncbi:branched-chain amino acid transport system II carrier protein [Candidatus Dependentiae bacterium]|nr:branched-chain amino acid transport system II carrier protein [Candidatus Dependentiae bacterium]